MSHDRDKKRSGNGRDQDRRRGMDRRLDDSHEYQGRDRRQTERRKSERQADKPIKR